MLKGTKKAAVLALAGLMVASLVSCGGKDKGNMTKEEKAAHKAQAKEYAKEGYKVRTNPVTKKAYEDFEAFKVIVADWWNPSDGSQSAEPANERDAADKAWHQFIMDEYNFDIDRYGIDDWGTHPETIANFCTTGGDENYVFVADNRSIAAGLKAGLFYDLNKIKSVDWTAPKWNQRVNEIMTKGNSLYGVRFDPPEPRYGLFFNKRLLKEAGIDPEKPYDLQAAGEWTWAAWEEMLKATTRDLDNDGIPDTYGMAHNTSYICHMAIESNGGRLITKDGSGNYVLNFLDDKCVEAMNWLNQLGVLYQKPQPEGANWDWFMSAFVNGEIAFCLEQQYMMSNWANNPDEWGFVCFPYGPNSKTKYTTMHDDWVYVIPACYDDARAEKIAMAFDLWSDDTPGFSDPDAWKESYYSLAKDTRAVDETLQYMRDNPNPIEHGMISGLEWGNVFWGIYPFGGSYVEACEAQKASFQGLIDEQNR